MATVRDPAFWKRFSTAVHLNDVESVAGSNASSPNLSKRPTLDHQSVFLPSLYVQVHPLTHMQRFLART